MDFWINPEKSIPQFLHEFRTEIEKYRVRPKAVESDSVVLVDELIPGDYIFDTNLNLLLDFYETTPNLRSFFRPKWEKIAEKAFNLEIPAEVRRPLSELAIISYLSLEFKEEVKNKEYFISRLINSYNEMRFQLHWALQLRKSGNTIAPKFLNPHKDFDIFVITKNRDEIEVECKTQSKESGTRIDKHSILQVSSFQAEICNRLEKRTCIIIDCEQDIRNEDVKKLVEKFRAKGLDVQELDFKEEVNGKKFTISYKVLGNRKDETGVEEIEQYRHQYGSRNYQFGHIFLPLDENTVEGFSFVSLKSLQVNRQLYNLSKGVIEAANYQFTGSKPSLVILHLDAQVDVERVTNNQNFMGLFSNILRDNPNVSGVIFSSIDLSKPSGEGYLLGRFVPIANLKANHSIVGIEIPGLLTKEHFQ